MEAKEVSVIVYSARSLPDRKKGRRKYSVVFGIGSNKFRTEAATASDGKPVWNEETAIVVDSDQHPLLLTMRDAHDPLGQISVPLASLPGYRQNRTNYVPLQPHKKCPDPQGELLFEAWVSKYGSPQSNNHLTVENGQGTSKHGTFSRIKGSLGSPLAKRKSPLFGRKKLPDSPPKASMSRRHSKSLSDLSKLHDRWDSAGVQDSILVKESGVQNLAAAPFMLVAPQLQQRRTTSHVDLSAEDLGKPEITGISPCQGPISGGTRITIRGHCLGMDKADVVGLFICGANCLGAVEFESSYKLFVTTKPWKPITGYITVETQSGGKGTSLVQFTFVDPSQPQEEAPISKRSRSNSDGNMKSPDDENNRKSGLFSWLHDNKENKDKVDKLEKTKAALEAAEKEIVKLKAENQELRETNKTMKLYIDSLVMRVMNECPEALCSERPRSAAT